MSTHSEEIAELRLECMGCGEVLRYREPGYTRIPKSISSAFRSSHRECAKKKTAAMMRAQPTQPIRQPRRQNPF